METVDKERLYHLQDRMVEVAGLRDEAMSMGNIHLQSKYSGQYYELEKILMLINVPTTL